MLDDATDREDRTASHDSLSHTQGRSGRGSAGEMIAVDHERGILTHRLRPFLRESLAIEGIYREPTAEELDVTLDFILMPEVGLWNVVALVDVYAPGHVLRDNSELNVRVGNYVAPKGGKKLVQSLEMHMSEINHGAISPWHAHVAYEMLHPFTDGNGRSGRALWAWHMLKIGSDPFSLPFLHRWYYQTLENSR